MSEPGAIDERNSRYQNRLFQVEPIGVERVQKSERHGSPFQLFTLWLGANLTIADFALGFLPVHLGLSWSSLLISIIIGNVLGAIMVAMTAAMGPKFGFPQLIIGRLSFGKLGGYLPAFLNWISTIGWFTVNNILGTFGLRFIFPHLSFFAGSIILIAVQGVLAVYGHNLIHAFERMMSVVLGVLFLVATFMIAGSHGIAIQQYHGGTLHPLANSIIVLSAAFSYLASWAPYASDYSRYLPEETSKGKVIGWAFWGSVISSTWLEIVGTMVAIAAGPHGTNAISSFAYVMGNWSYPMVIAVILGGIASNSLNLYSNALSAGALDLHISRTGLTIAAMVVGLILSFAGVGKFESFYEDFLLLLGYWVTPWIAILLIDFFIFRRNLEKELNGIIPAIGKGTWAFLIGILVSIPFFSSTLYTGPIANQLNGADISFYVGFLVAGIIYLMIGRSKGITKIG